MLSTLPITIADSPGLACKRALRWPLPLSLQPILSVLVLLFCTALQAESGTANLDAAERLLRVADIGSRFESRTRQQAQQIIYNYSAIVQRTTDNRLPVLVERRIAECYAEAYRWEHFEQGIARIVANNFSSEELELLIDFHRNLALPPNKITLFRNTIAKADVLQQESVDYIFEHSTGCVDSDAELIIQHLASQQIP